MRSLSWPVWVTLAIGCGDAATTDTDDTDPPEVELTWPTLECDPIVDYCGFPFPSNVFTVADDTTPTGRRVALAKATMPRSVIGEGSLPDPFNDADGFSPGGPLLAWFPGATEEGLAGPNAIEDSLSPDSKTILINTITRQLVPHWAELDRLATDGTTDQVFLIHPAVRLDDETRYVVGIRGLVDGSGATIAPTAPFQDLIDGNDAERADLYEDIFTNLEDKEWSRQEVQLAWDFTTRSKQDITGRLRHMREEALDALVDEAPAYEIVSVQTGAELGWDDHVAFVIEGTFEAPLFLDQLEPGGVLLLDDEGLPRVNDVTPTIDVPFRVMIPNSAVDGGARPPVMYGHGLFGDRDQVTSSTFRSWADEYGYVMFAVDLLGMASDDEAWLSNPLTTPMLTGEMHRVVRFHDRLHQGFLHHVLAMRLMKSSFAEDPTYGQYISPEEAFYYGISQGGIMGVVHAGLSTDFERAALGVMGQPYSVLLPRSVDFAPFFDILKIALVDGRDLHLALALAQQTWTRVEPDGWSAYVTRNTIDARTPVKTLLLRDALGDHQVTTLGAHIMARTLGAKLVTTGNGPVYGLSEVVSSDNETALVEYSFGLPPAPPCNLPMDLCDDPHEAVRRTDAARLQLDSFFQTGRIKNECPDDLCIYEELSGCEAGEDEAASLAVCAL